MKLYYLFDADKKAALNARGLDYLPAYIPAIIAHIGTSAAPIAPAELDTVTDDDIILIGAGDGIMLPENYRAAILLGADAPETADAPEIYGYYKHEGYDIPLFVKVLATEGEGEVLANASACGKTLPALVKRGERIFDFRFDLATTAKVAADGIPKGSSPYGFPYGRTPDFRPLPNDHDSSMPYIDLLIGELEEILVGLGMPLLYKLPPTNDGGVPDFAFHVSGDDDHGSNFIDRNAAETMHKYGMPYHLNAMPVNDDYVIDKDDYDYLASIGCEVALHTDFTQGGPTEEVSKGQFKSFIDNFGYHPVTNVNHCLIQQDNLRDRMRWLAECDIIGDNGMLGEIKYENINAFNLTGFGFGSSFPYYITDDAAHGNALISCPAIPLTYYEPRLNDSNYNEPEKITGYLDAAAKDGRMAQFFMHPHYFDPANPDVTFVHAALDLAFDHIKKCGYTPLLTTTNNIAKFWQARCNADIKLCGKTIEVECATDVIVRLPDAVAKVSLDGNELGITEKTVGGKKLKLVTLKAGKNEIQLG